MEPPKRYILDGNGPQHHAISTELNRAGRRGKHRGSTITKLRGGRTRATHITRASMGGALMSPSGSGSLQSVQGR